MQKNLWINYGISVTIVAVCVDVSVFGTVLHRLSLHTLLSDVDQASFTVLAVLLRGVAFEPVMFSTIVFAALFGRAVFPHMSTFMVANLYTCLLYVSDFHVKLFTCLHFFDKSIAEFLAYVLIFLNDNVLNLFFSIILPDSGDCEYRFCFTAFRYFKFVIVVLWALSLNHIYGRNSALP